MMPMSSLSARVEDRVRDSSVCLAQICEYPEEILALLDRNAQVRTMNELCSLARRELHGSMDSHLETLLEEIRHLVKSLPPLADLFPSLLAETVVVEIQRTATLEFFTSEDDLESGFVTRYEVEEFHRRFVQESTESICKSLHAACQNLREAIRRFSPPNISGNCWPSNG